MFVVECINKENCRENLENTVNIDNCFGGAVKEMIVVPQVVMLECTKRWCKEK